MLALYDYLRAQKSSTGFLRGDITKRMDQLQGKIFTLNFNA